VMLLAALYNIKAGCIFSIDGYVKNISEGNVKPNSKACERGIKSAIKSALDAIVILNRGCL